VGSQQAVWDALAQVGKALGNGHRLVILDRLAQSDLSVDAIAQSVNLPVANVSQHLQLLRRAGLVNASRHGKQVVYRLTDNRTVSVIDLLRQVAETHVADVAKLASGLFTDEHAKTDFDVVSRAELLAGLQQQSILLLDVRPAHEFDHGHLPNAVNAPMASLATMLDQLPTDIDIVAYCRGPYCVFSHQAVLLLTEKGFRVRRYEEGFPQWKAAGLPIE
jgi:ArsR family transcriptional regulator